MGIGADALCVKPMDIEGVFLNTKGYSGIANQSPRSSNFKKVKYIKEKYGLSDKELDGPNTNTGTVFWNNCAMKDFGLGRKCLDMWENNMFFAADQSLFALASIPLPFNVLPMKYNYRLGNKNDRARELTDVFVYHYTGKKPWKGKTLAGDKWVEFSKSILTCSKEK